jgi:membrane protein CcdC involved in cytochrome C biogenesis
MVERLLITSQVPWRFMMFAAYRKEKKECLYFIGNGTARNT